MTDDDDILLSAIVASMGGDVLELTEEQGVRLEWWIQSRGGEEAEA